jgi:hypothetical protein
MATQPVEGSLSAGVAATILPANDGVRGWLGRDQLHVYNTGQTNPMNVAIGQTATSADIYIAPYDCLVLRIEGGQPLPADYISAISAGGTTYTVWSG